ncbi:ribonuclease H-like domain-containing protein [Tanacetum coccineum]
MNPLQSNIVPVQQQCPIPQPQPAQSMAQPQHAFIAATASPHPAQLQAHFAAQQPMFYTEPQPNLYYDVSRCYTYMPNAFQSQATMFPEVYQTMTSLDPSWNMDTGASSHLLDNTGILTSFSSSSMYPSVFVGNGHSIPVTHTGHSFLHTSSKPLHLNHILVTPHIIKNLISVHQFTRDNDVSVEFNAYGFLVKHYQTGWLLLCCDSTGDLYSVTQQPSSQTSVVLLSFSFTIWHRRLGHPGDDVLRRLESRNLISYRKSKLSALCHACQLAHIPPSYWVEVLNMAALLLNLLPSTAINNEIPFTKLYNQNPTYEHLHVFGCLCYPHIDVSHKLEPRSTPCIFFGYPTNHRGYRCLDLASNKIIISRHMRFDEDVFPFGNVTSSNKPTYDFLLPPIQTTTNVPTTEPFVQHMDEPNNPITPHPTTPPTSPPQPDTHPSHSSTPIPTSAQTQSHAQTVDSHTPIPINNSSQTMPTHPMVTRAKAGIFKPLERMNCHVTTTSPLPRSHIHTLHDPNWKEAILDKYNALITNRTWVLVPRPTNANVVYLMWLFKHKFNADGSLSSLVVKPATIRTVLSLVVSRDWPIHQLDVKNAFLLGHLSEIVYMYQPPGSDIAYLMLYVDDIILTASSSAFLQRIIASLHKSKIGSKGDPVSDPTLYRSLAGALQYLSFTRPDLSYDVYTLDYGLQLHVSSTTQLSTYTDVDWAGCPVTNWSTSEYYVFLSDNLLSWSVKCQVTLSRSSAEAEYRGVANVVAKTAWIRNLLCELHTPLFTTTLVYCDNVSAVYMSTNLVQHQRTKHIEIDIHFVRDFVALGQVCVLHVPSRFQYANIFTKGLPTALFIEFCSSLNVRRSPAHTEGEY